MGPWWGQCPTIDDIDHELTGTEKEQRSRPNPEAASLESIDQLITSHQVKAKVDPVLILRRVGEFFGDMDTKVKAMIKLIEEDADSFARRAEMYYKKRPELMKMVEEFYRAYRALAERYDHATGALRHAHRTMSEAFPNHIPLALPDESPSISSGTEGGPYTPEMTAHVGSPFDPDDLHRDSLGKPMYSHMIDRSGAHAEESEIIMAKKGLKQLNEMLSPREGTARIKLHEGKVRKGLNFQEDEEKILNSKYHHMEPKIHMEQEVKEKENYRSEVKLLQEEVSRLSMLNENLKIEVASESKHLDEYKAEVHNLRDALSKLESEKQVAFNENKLSQDSISSLEIEIFEATDEIRELHEEILMGVVKVCSAEDQFLISEKANLSLKLETERRKRELEEIQISLLEKQNLLGHELKKNEKAQKELKHLQEQFSQLSIKNQDLKNQIVIESNHLDKSRSEVLKLREAMSKLVSEKEESFYQSKLYRESISTLEIEIFEATCEIMKLHEQVLVGVVKFCSAEEQFLVSEKASKSLQLEVEERKKGLEEIQVVLTKKQNLLEQEVKKNEEARTEVNHLQEQLSELSNENQDRKGWMASESRRWDLYKIEVLNMRHAMLKLKSEKEASFYQNKLYGERISSLETEFSEATRELRKLHEEILIEFLKLCTAEEHFLLSEKASQSLKLEVEKGKRELEEMQKFLVENKSLLEQEVKRNDEARNQVKHLQEQLSQLSIENRDLKNQIVSESKHLDLSRTEVLNLRDAMSKLESEKEASFYQNKLYGESISRLETETMQATGEIRKLHEEILMGAVKMCSMEEKCISLDKENQSLILELQEGKRGLKEIKMLSIESQSRLEEEVKQKEKARNEIKQLQEELDLSIAEVQNLKNVMLKLESEKEAALVQNQLYLEDMSNLESDIFKAKDEVRILHEEIMVGIVKLFGAEEHCLTMEKANQSLISELEDRDQQRMEAVRSLQSMEELYDMSQEKIKHMTVEMQTYVGNLKDTEDSKVRLEEKVCKLEDMNCCLNEQNNANALKIEHLQCEINSLKEINSNVADDSKLLQQELDSVMDDRNELDLKYKDLIEQMEVARLNIGSLESLVKELQHGHAEMKEGCWKLEDEKLLLLNKLKDMNAISEMNAALEKSLSDANVNLEVLREKIGVLIAEVSVHVVEKAVLNSELKVLGENMEMLSEKNTLLHDSMDGANKELEGLRLSLRDLENSCHFLSEENSNLDAQKNALIAQVESIEHSLANLGSRHCILEENYVNIEKERNLSVAQVMELNDALRNKQRDHESEIQSSKNLLNTLENQIHLLQEDRMLREEELDRCHQDYLSYMIDVSVLQRCLQDITDSFRTEKQKLESLIQSSNINLANLKSQIDLLHQDIRIIDEELKEEQQKSMNFELEISIWQQSLSEMSEKNFILSQECEKHIETSKYADGIISELQASELCYKEKSALLLEHNTKLWDGCYLLLESLDIKKELMNMDSIEDVLQTILGEIKNMVASISEIQDDNHLLYVELLVCGSLLKQNGLEKVFLGQELQSISKSFLALQMEHRQLFEANGQLKQDVHDGDCTNKTLIAEMESLNSQFDELSKELYNLRVEKNALEDENSVMLGEAITLEHLYLFFRSLNAENMQSLKIFDDEICSFLAVKSDLDEKVKRSEERFLVLENENQWLRKLLEELRSQAMILEFDLITNRGFLEELSFQAETEENMLKKKRMELLKACDKLQCTQEEVTELCTKLEVKSKELDEAKLMILALEKNIAVLLEGHTCKDKEISNSYKENKMLNDALHRLNGLVEELKEREHYLSSELHKKIVEVDFCEGDISKLLSEVVVSALNGIVLEEKIFELAVAFECLEICAMMQRTNIHEEIGLINAHEMVLKKKLHELESENRKLKASLNACIPLFLNLGNGLATVKRQAHQLAELHGNQENPSTYHEENQVHETITSDQATASGALVLQKLTYQVEELEKLMVDTRNHLEQERHLYAADLEAARTEIEVLKLMITDIQKGQGNENEASIGKYEHTMKDIELDQASNSNGLSRIQSADSEDQMLKLWETQDRDYSNLVSNGHGIEVVEEVKSEQPSSELVSEKELGVVDKLEISQEMRESREEWKRRVLKRISSGGEKLSALRIIARELRGKTERASTSRQQKSTENDEISAKLNEAEEEISQLLNVNERLMKKAEEYTKPSNGEEMGRRGKRRRVSEQARRASERIEKLELELQKLHYILLKLEDGFQSNKTRRGDRSASVLLRDYIYGRGKKRGPFCRCMKPKTME
ncbi:hypothetical protein AXF42_Ash014274 [Apostasia shenzhenica]|uniref:NAB domain-containing protein n=1 Tax=Apostasia shenzhenica TaxID=1088818 RepID=A0A2I0A1F3_9ASPA|nr:hypothetical protein AXF42_Ash014274 [Apostasia shenzhenica]